eukprot:GHVL01044411.1.p1 GENE.GHVL01044411.1~~GHVL01044411.1.p1  ORF type:complete len:662 (-),score=120.87 GHVL01044411.1:343-2259(-)
MSQFRDTFTKEEKREPLLDYDDSAFLHFASTILICILIPLIWHILSVLLQKTPDIVPKSTPDGHQYKELKSDLYGTWKNERKKERYSAAKRFGVAFWLKVSAAIIMLYMTRLCFQNMSLTSVVKGFDPFLILEIDASASVGDIKKAYRRQSLKHHPDKNLNDPLAASKFNLIHKAYEVLTDETAKMNYEKYGNPDGPAAMKIGVGLPRILVEEENQLAILCIFFIFLLLVVPVCFICYYQRQKKYAPNGVQLETLHFISYNLSETTRFRHAVEFIACSAESRELKLRPEDREEMKLVITEVEDMKKPKYNLPIIIRNNYLILAHLQRLHHLLSPRLKKDLQIMLRSSMKITHAMIEVAAMRDWFQTAASIVELRRCLVQALDQRSSDFLQIPYLDEERVKHITRGKNSASCLAQFIKQDPSERKGLAGLTDDQLEDIQEFLEYITNMEIDASIGVDDENEIVHGDVATVTVNFTRLQLKEGEAQGPVLAPYFPLVKFEEWFLFVVESNSGKVLNIHRTQNPSRTFSETIQFQVTGVGKQCVTLKAMSDSYVGIDREIELVYNVFTEQQVTREIIMHKEDEDLDKEPTFFQQLVGQLEDEGSSDEEEDTKAINNSKAKSPKSKEVVQEEQFQEEATDSE